MRIVDPSLTRWFAKAGICELCKCWCRSCEGHHIFAKGMGGGGQLDIYINLIRLGRTKQFVCDCHTKIHSKVEPCTRRSNLILKVAEREDLEPELIESTILQLRNLPKETTREELIDLNLSWAIGPTAMWGYELSAWELEQELLRKSQPRGVILSCQ